MMNIINSLEKTLHDLKSEVGKQCLKWAQAHQLNLNLLGDMSDPFSIFSEDEKFELICGTIYKLSQCGGFVFGDFVINVLIPWFLPEENFEENFEGLLKEYDRSIDIWFDEKESWDNFLDQIDPNIMVLETIEEDKHYALKICDETIVDLHIYISPQLPLTWRGLYVDLLCFVPESIDFRKIDRTWFRVGKDREGEWERFSSIELIESVFKKESYVCLSAHKEMMKCTSVNLCDIKGSTLSDNIRRWDQFNNQWKLLPLDEVKNNIIGEKKDSLKIKPDPKETTEEKKDSLKIKSKIKCLLNLCENEVSRKKGAEIAIEIFDTLKNNKWFLDISSKFQKTVKNKLISFLTEEDFYLPSYFFEIYNDYILNHIYSPSISLCDI